MSFFYRFNDLTAQEQSKFEVTMRIVTSIHTKAKEQFQRQKYIRCISEYQRSIHVINLSRPQTETEKTDIKKLKVTSLVNLAVCYSKVNKPRNAIQVLDNLDYLIDTEQHCKALFYYGKANELLGKTDLALDYYQKALKLEPKNKDIGKALEDLDLYVKKSSKIEKDMWLNVFKSESKKSFPVSEDFQNGVKEMFKDLVSSNEYAKFDLAPGLKSDEVEFVKDLAKSFNGLIVHEEGQGRKRKITVIKKP